VTNKFRIITEFLRENRGQDLAEYCLITAFIAVGSCAVYFQVSGGVSNIWTHANATLISQNTPASASAPASAPAAAPSSDSGMTLHPAAHENVPGTVERGSEKNDR